MQTTQRVRATPSRDIDAEVGRRIHMLMWDQGLTQTALCSMTGLEHLDQSSLAKKLRGQRKWALADLMAIASALDVPVASLLEDAPSGPRPVGPQDTGRNRGGPPTGSVPPAGRVSG